MTNDLSRSQITRLAVSYLGIRTKSRIYPSTKEVMCHCPFHVDKSPSMGIDLERGIYNCFSCGSRGTIESLFRELTGDDLYKTLGIANNPFVNFARNSIQVYKWEEPKVVKKSVYVNYNKSDFVPATKNLLSLRYLLRRGISQQTADSMGFLYCEDTTINTTRFINRLCIPIYEDGVLCSIEGRKILSEDYGPKVLYPKNTSVDTLYGIDNLDRDKTLFACEGLMDLALLRGCRETSNSTSIFGANVTTRQLDLLSQFKKVVYIADKDIAGDKTLETLKSSGLDNVYRLDLPEKQNDIKIKDIGDLPKAKSSVRQLIDTKWLLRIEKL